MITARYTVLFKFADQAEGVHENMQTEEPKDEIKCTEEGKEEINEMTEDRKTQLVNQVKEGWRKKSSETITVGEVRSTN